MAQRGSKKKPKTPRSPAAYGLILRKGAGAGRHKDKREKRKKDRDDDDG